MCLRPDSWNLMRSISPEYESSDDHFPGHFRFAISSDRIVWLEYGLPEGAPGFSKAAYADAVF